jgi:glycosyltransferase involved in cell wall biosynthesis
MAGTEGLGGMAKLSQGPMRVVWAYDKEHLQHPFIVLGLNALADAGYQLTMVAADKAEGERWASFDDFSAAERFGNYQRLVHEIRKDLEQQAVDSVLIAKKARKPLVWEKQGLIKPLKPEERKRLRREVLRHTWRHRWIQLVRAVLKDYGNARRFTWDLWKIYLRGFRRLAGLKAEVMITSRPEASFWAALVAKARGMRLVYFTFELYGEQIARPSWFLLWFERFMLRHLVDAVITQNDCRAQVLQRERGSRVTPLLVHNYKPIHSEHRPGGRLREKHGLKPGTRVVLYEGMIVDGRWLEYVAQSVIHLPEDVVLVMMGQEKLKWRQVHADQIKDALVTGRLVLAGPVPHEELPDYVADADVGVIIYDDSVRNNVFCEPGKLSDYIAVGVPVVAPAFPTIGPVVQGFDIGRCFEGHSPEAIAATIMSVLERPKAAWAPSLERACAELTWETQVPNLLAAVAGVAPAYSPLTQAAQPGVNELGREPAASLRQ